MTAFFHIFVLEDASLKYVDGLYNIIPIDNFNKVEI
jgi:hypothetical protein